MSAQGNISTFIDKLFSLPRRTVNLFLILLLGIILRIIAAVNMSDSADSMHFVTHAINFLSAGRLVTYDQSAGLWHAFNSVLFNIFGATHFVSAIPALIFGSASIIALYLLTKEFFSERVALLAAFLLAIAPFHIKNTAPEMDVMAMFFVIAGMFFFIRGYKEQKNLFYAIGGVFFGLSIYTKVYTLLFVPSMLLYQGYMSYRKNKRPFISTDFKKIIIFLFCIGIFAIPSLTHNYLLYKEKGFVDLIYTNTLDLGKEKSQQFFGWDPSFGKPHNWIGFFFGNATEQAGEDPAPLFFIILRTLIFASPLIILLGILSFAGSMAFKKQRNKYAILFIFSIIFVYPFVGSTNILPKHFIFLEILIIPLAALFLEKGITKLTGSFKHDTTRIVLFIILIATLIFLAVPSRGTFPHFYGKSYVTQMIEFKDANIPSNALVIADSRIYRGQVYWALYGRPFLEAQEFMQLYSKQQELPGNLVNIETYYLECALPGDDCGWGSIASQPELNASMESLASAFKNQSRLVATITEPDRTKTYFPFINKEKKVMAINFYKTTLTIKESIVQAATQPRNWFLYYTGYPNPSKEFDAYEPRGAFNSLLNTLAHFIVLIALFLAFISPLFLLYYLIALNDSIENSDSSL